MNVDTIDLSNFLTGHVVNIGPMVEEMENNIRQQIEGVYFGKYPCHDFFGLNVLCQIVLKLPRGILLFLVNFFGLRHV